MTFNLKSHLAILLFLFQGISSILAQARYPFQNPDLAIEKRVDDLISRLTPEEKIKLMMDRSPAIERLGIPAYGWWNEALHGVARAGLATVFPQAVAMAATFNDADHFQTFSIISDEARAKYNDFVKKEPGRRYEGLSFWTPNINIFRDPRWGRGMETYGEDPYLTTRFGLACVKGLQGNDPKYYKSLACAKHYAVHSGPEWNRHSFNAETSDHDLWETYLPAFKALVKEANVQQVMCAYNRFEGAPCCGSGKLLMDILRNKWGYKALVVSDCGAINDFYGKGLHETHPDAAAASAAAVLSGTDIECGTSYRSLSTSLQKGLINEKDLDVSLRRIFRSRFELGIMDQTDLTPWAKLSKETVDCQKHKDHALKVARESMTLLKNNGVLPLSKNIKTLAVIGPNAKDTRIMLANYNGTPSNTVSVLDGIKAKLPQTNIIFDRGCDLVDQWVKISLMDQVRSGNSKGFRAEYFAGSKWEGAPIVTKEGIQQIKYTTGGGTVFEVGVPLEKFSARYTGDFTAAYTGKVFFTMKADDGYKLEVDGKILSENNRKAASSYLTVPMDVEKGKTYAIRLSYCQTDLSAYLEFLVHDRKPLEFDALKESIKNADAIVYVGGLSPSLEGEEMPVNWDGFRGGDRTVIELPVVQQNILKELRATGKPIIFVLCAGSAIGLANVDQNYDALLNAWYGGQSGGTAVADVLFGDYNPAGRLPITFYKSTAQLPDFESYEMKNRTYRYFTDAPLYPFGYGLSYSKFVYGNPTLSATTIKKNDGVKLTVDVTNNSNRSGEEVVQVYIRYLDNKNAPLKSLKAFKRIPFKSGITQKVSFDLPTTAFETYLDDKVAMGVAGGQYEIMVGSSSRIEDLKTLRLQIK
ncbi:MAG: glycoside hydrolase family 3 C-terminal domain-containing protein [Bacteroidales bacterium]